MTFSVEGKLSQGDREWIKKNATSGIIEEFNGTTRVHKTTFTNEDEGLLFKLYYEKK